jgi:hypothetical protein
MRAAFAARDMAAERRGAAALDRRHRLQLAETDMAGIGMAPGGAVLAENVRDFQPGASHRRRRLPGCLLPPWLVRLQLARLGFAGLADELVDRARHRGDAAGRHAGVMRRGLQPVMAEQSLDQPDVGAMLEQMRGEAVPQRMQRLPQVSRSDFVLRLRADFGGESARDELRSLPEDALASRAPKRFIESGPARRLNCVRIAVAGCRFHP